MRRLKLRLALIPLVLSALSPGLLLSQANPNASFAPVDVNQQFFAINTSLNQTADLILTSGSKTMGRQDVEQAQQSTESPRAPSVKTDQPAERQTSRFDSIRALIKSILLKEGVPVELAAVMVVESGGNPLALSPKGARGLWQLMPDTARRYGLVVDSRRDDRLDLAKSTESAARYLRDLHLQFGSWPLALAAYNTGEQNVQKAISRSNSRDFGTLSDRRYVPEETRNYVPAVLAAMRSTPERALSTPEPQPNEGTGRVFAPAGQ